MLPGEIGGAASVASTFQGRLIRGPHWRFFLQGWWHADMSLKRSFGGEELGAEAAVGFQSGY
jgi:hypothetical protein